MPGIRHSLAVLAALSGQVEAGEPAPQTPEQQQLDQESARRIAEYQEKFDALMKALALDEKQSAELTRVYLADDRYAVRTRASEIILERARKDIVRTQKPLEWKGILAASTVDPYSENAFEHSQQLKGLRDDIKVEEMDLDWNGKKYHPSIAIREKKGPYTVRERLEDIALQTGNPACLKDIRDMADEHVDPSIEFDGLSYWEAVLAIRTVGGKKLHLSRQNCPHTHFTAKPNKNKYEVTSANRSISVVVIPQINQDGFTEIQFHTEPRIARSFPIALGAWVTLEEDGKQVRLPLQISIGDCEREDKIKVQLPKPQKRNGEQALLEVSAFFQGNFTATSRFDDLTKSEEDEENEVRFESMEQDGENYVVKAYCPCEDECFGPSISCAGFDKEEKAIAWHDEKFEFDYGARSGGWKYWYFKSPPDRLEVYQPGRQRTRSKETTLRINVPLLSKPELHNDKERKQEGVD